MKSRAAGANSRRQYERGAKQMLSACARRVGVAWDGADARQKVKWLLSHLESDDPLCPGTVSMYRQCARVAVQGLLSEVGAETLEASGAIEASRITLDKRIGRPVPKRGASNKVRDPLVMELGDIVAHLRDKYIRGRDRLDLILALYIIVMPRIGLRPVELTWAEWDGGYLYTRTAKRIGRPRRRVPHEHWPPVYKMALGLLIALMPRQLDDATFEAWRNVLASRLARASIWSRKKRRLSLYFARHIAIANWKQAGITPELIAQLAGHAGLRSQHHYASGKAGYGARFVFLDQDEAQALLGDAPDAVAEKSASPTTNRPEVRTLEDDATQGPSEQKLEFAVEDIPKPTVKPQPKSGDDGAMLWQEHKRQIEAVWNRSRRRGNTGHIRTDQMDHGQQSAEGESSDEVPLRDDDFDGKKKP